MTFTKDEICSFKNLYKAMQLCKRGVMWKDSVAGYVMNALSRTYYLKNNLMHDPYKVGKYNRFTVHEPKERNIVSVNFKDRVFQKSLVDNYFYDEISRSFIHDNAACQIGKGTEHSRKRLICHMQRYWRKHGLEGYVLKGDLSNFFGSTKHDLAYSAVAKRVDDEWVKSVSKAVIDSHVYGPQKGIGLEPGSAVVQLIQLAVLDEFDHFVKEQLRIKYYDRYNDDFIMIHSDREYLKMCLSKVDEWMSTRGLTLNPRKTQIAKLSQGIKFLGFRFRLTDTGKVLMTLLPEKVSKEKRKLRKLVAKTKNGEISKEDVNGNFRSFKANISNSGKKRKGNPGRRARRSCHGLELEMDQFYKRLWEG